MKIIERIQKLLEKTVENGCTQEEAQSALLLARKLMIKYKLSKNAINRHNEDIVKQELPYDCTIFYNISLLKVFLNNFPIMHFFIKHGDKLHCILFGNKIDTDCVSTLMRCAHQYMLDASENYTLSIAELFGEKDCNIQTSYIRGFIQGLNDKYVEQNKLLNKNESLMIIPDKDVENAFKRFSKDFKSEKIEFTEKDIDTSEFLATTEGYKVGKKFGSTELTNGYTLTE